MLVVVVVEELFTEQSGVLNRPEKRWERRAVFQRFERGFGVGVVVGHCENADLVWYQGRLKRSSDLVPL